MRVFVTGATGWVGSVVVQELLAAGHQVIGLARNDAAAAKLAQLGVEVQRGELSDPGSLTAAAQTSDGVIHTAFIHDFSRFENSVKLDREAIEAMGAALAGSGRPFIVTSGTAMLAPGRIGTENDTADTSSHASPRHGSETATLQLAAQGVRSAVIRLPPSVHGEGDHGFVPAIINAARTTGAAPYVGDGANRWASVHRLDAAKLYRLVLEGGRAGARYHAVADEGVPVREIAGVISRRLGVPARSITPEEASAQMGFIGGFVGSDVPASSALTRAELGWEPTQPSLLADLDHDYYFSH